MYWWEHRNVSVLNHECFFVCFFFFLNQILTAGIGGSFSVIYMDPLNEFHASAALKSWLFNIGRGLHCLAGQGWHWPQSPHVFAGNRIRTYFGNTYICYAIIKNVVGPSRRVFGWPAELRVRPPPGVHRPRHGPRRPDHIVVRHLALHLLPVPHSLRM